MQNDEIQEEKRLIDHVRIIIKSFPPRYYFTFHNITAKLDAMGLKYNKGGLKGGILPTLLRQEEIEKDIDNQGLIRYRRRINQEQKKTMGKPKTVRQKPIRELRPNPALIALLIAKQYMTAPDLYMIADRQLQRSFTKGAIYFMLNYYRKKNLVDVKTKTINGSKAKKIYLIKPELFEEAQKRIKKILSFAPEAEYILKHILQNDFNTNYNTESENNMTDETAPPPEKKKDKAKLTRRFQSIRPTPLLIVLLTSKRYMIASEISKLIEKDFDMMKGSSKAAIYHTLNAYAKKGLVDSRINTLIYNHPTEYKATDNLFKTALKIRDKVFAKFPHMNEQIETALRDFEEKQKIINESITPETPAETSPAVETTEIKQDPNGSIDWELPENYFSAVDVGAAIFEYMQSLNRQLKKVPHNQEAEKVIARLKYDLDEQKARTFTALEKTSVIERENKRLKDRIEKLKNDHEEIKQQAHNLQIALDEKAIRPPKSSFKLSEVARVIKIAEDNETPVIDGSKKLSKVF